MNLAQLCSPEQRLGCVLAEDTALSTMAEKMTVLRQDPEWRPASMSKHSFRATGWNIRKDEDAWDFFRPVFMAEAYQLIEAFIMDLCQTRRGLRCFDNAVCAWFREDRELAENQMFTYL